MNRGAAVILSVDLMATRSYFPNSAYNLVASIDLEWEISLRLAKTRRHGSVTIDSEALDFAIH